MTVKQINKKSLNLGLEPFKFSINRPFSKCVCWWNRQGRGFMGDGSFFTFILANGKIFSFACAASLSTSNQIMSVKFWGTLSLQLTPPDQTLTMCCRPYAESWGELSNANSWHSGNPSGISVAHLLT